jgi:very-short-patch-repair endonuclease
VGEGGSEQSEEPGEGDMRQRVSKQKRALAKSLRRRPTDAERTLWRLLRSRRFIDAKFRRQVPIGPWVVDFASFERRLIVEADGGRHNESRTDARRDDDLAARGFQIIRYWNNDILVRRESVLEHLATVIASSPSPGFAPNGAQPPSPTKGEGR